jgi:DNA-binding transcriptional ArsR family regulator
MSLTGPLGDLPISHPQAMRALAHPVRLAVLTFLQHNGPATATQLSSHVRATPSVTSWHLRHLATFGLVTDADPDEVPGDRRQRWWKAAARGSSVELADGDEAGTAVRMLSDQLEDAARRQVDRWHAESEPELEHAWRRLAGLSNTSVRLTETELEQLQHAVDELLVPYVHRTDPPAGARQVRVLRQYLPEAGR